MLYLFLLILAIAVVPALVIAYSIGLVAAIFEIMHLHKKPQKEPYSTWLPDNHRRG